MNPLQNMNSLQDSNSEKSKYPKATVISNVIIDKIIFRTMKYDYPDGTVKIKTFMYHLGTNNNIATEIIEQ